MNKSGNNASLWTSYGLAVTLYLFFCLVSGGVADFGPVDTERMQQKDERDIPARVSSAHLAAPGASRVRKPPTGGVEAQQVAGVGIQ